MTKKEGPKSGKYAQTLVAVFQKKFQKDVTEVPFTQEELREAAKTLGFEFRNFPDLNYYLRSRANSLPKEIVEKGFNTIESRGRGLYAIVKNENRVILPARILNHTISFKLIPEKIRDLLTADEQSLLSVVHYIELLDKFLGFPCYHLQGHLRTTGFMGQQIEADDVYIGLKGGERCAIPIEAKGVREKIGLSQIKSTVDAVLRKLPGLPIIPLAIQLKNDGLIHIIEFSVKIKGHEIQNVTLKKAAAFVPDIHLKNWPKPLDLLK